MDCQCSIGRPTTVISTMATAAAPKITVHHLNNSRSSRILWLLEELELPYEMKEYKRDESQLPL